MEPDAFAPVGRATTARRDLLALDALMLAVLDGHQAVLTLMTLLRAGLAGRTTGGQQQKHQSHFFDEAGHSDHRSSVTDPAPAAPAAAQAAVFTVAAPSSMRRPGRGRGSVIGSRATASGRSM